MSVSGAGNVYVTGFTTDLYVDDDDDSLYFQQVTTLKYGSTLGLVWAHNTPPGNNSAKAEEPTPSGNAVVSRGDTCYVAADGYFYESRDFDMLTLSYVPSTGSVRWDDWYNAASVGDYGKAITLDASGSVYSAGSAWYDTVKGRDLTIVKYWSSGSRRWVGTYDGPYGGRNDYDEALAATCDAGHNAVYATGTSTAANGNFDIVTVKYDTLGTMAWASRYAGSAGSNDAAYAVALDAAGDVYVAGVSGESGNGMDMLLAKLDRQDGDTLWVRHYGGTAGGDDAANAVAVDAEGSVYMAGYVTNTGTGKDFCVVKYTSWGSLVRPWTWDDSSHGEDMAVSVAVDDDRNMYVAGFGLGPTDQDIYMLRYEQSGFLDIGISSIVSPPDTVDYGQPIVPKVVVFASDSTSLQESVQVTMRIGDFYQKSKKALPPAGQSVNVTFDTWYVQQTGQHTVVCTLAVTDSNPANDRAQKTTTVPAGWKEKEPVPTAPSGTYAKDGAWLVYDSANGRVYAAKGNKQVDFYAYAPVQNAWNQGLMPIPLGVEFKKPSKGCAGCVDPSGFVYMTKGNNTLGFWRYDVAEDTWIPRQNVPLGGGKKVKGGTGLAYANGSVYLLKGYKNEFYKYNPVDSAWTTLHVAPVGQYNHWKWDKGSWLAYDGDHTIYAHKAKYHEFYRYNVNSDSWSTALHAMPVYGSTGKKKTKDGGCGAWLDGRIYALKGGNTQEFWRYTAATDSWHEMDILPRVGTGGKKKKVKAGGSITSDGNVLYAQKGNKCNEFWRYVPNTSGGSDMGYASGGGGGRDAGETPVLEGTDSYGPKWRSDGMAFITCHEDSANWMQVYQVEYSGGIGKETRITDTTCDCEEASYDLSGDRVCFSLLDDDGFYQVAVVDLNGGFLGDGSAGEDAAAAPSQALSAKGRPPATLEVGEIQVLTAGEHDHVSCSFSPTGSYITYIRDSDDGDDDVYIIPSNGGSEIQVTSCGSSHADPVWLSTSVIAYTHIPDADWDQIGKVSTSTHIETDLTSSAYDHAKADALGNGSTLCSERYGDDGTQIVKFSANGGAETVLTTGVQDMEVPDWATSASIFCTRWTGITSAICRVNAMGGGWTAVTDSSAIRDNPDCWYNQLGNTSYVLYERENWEESFLLGGGADKKKWGTGIFKAHYREPLDGEQGASMYTFALEKAVPTPATNRVEICYQVPAEAILSLRVYNTAGQLVKVLADGRVEPGTYTSVWNGTDARGRRLANGVYFYALDNGSKRISRKLILTD